MKNSPTAAPAAGGCRARSAPSGRAPIFTGIGLPSTNSLVCKPSRRLLASRARAMSPDKAAAHISCISRGATFAVTRDHAVAAHQHQRSPVESFAAVDGEIPGRAPQQIAAALEAGGRVLDADDVGDLGPGAAPYRFAGRRRCVRERCTGSAADRRPRQWHENAGTCLPGWACCSTARRQAVLRARLFGRLGQLDRLGSGIGAGTRNYRNAPGRVLDREADQLLVFVEVDRGRFAGSADDDDACVPRRCANRSGSCIGRSPRPVFEHGVTMATRLPVNIRAVPLKKCSILAHYPCASIQLA